MFVVLCLISVAMHSGCGGGSSQPSISQLSIATTSLPNGTLDQPYSQIVQASGGVRPFTWSVTGTLPHNLGLVSSATNTATIAGTPDTAAQAAFIVMVVDSAGQSAAQRYSVSILSEPDTLTLSSPNLSFAPQLAGTASSAQTETLSNTGTAAVVIGSVAVAGTDVADFSQSNTCGSSLPAGANCAISVTFTPIQAGPLSATLTIIDNTAGSPHSAALNGVGLAAGPNTTWSATSLAFDNQVVNTTSPAQSLTLSNFGTGTLNISGIAAGANFAETDSCSGSSLASGSTCTVTVTFTPNATGTFSGTISVTDNAPGSPQTVSLTGTGVTSNYILTGNCFHHFVDSDYCGFTPDTAQCPAGARATTPTFTSCLQPRGVSVDASRSCVVNGISGLCVTKFDAGAASGAATSGDRLRDARSAKGPKD